LSRTLDEFRKLRSEGWQLQEVSLRAKTGRAIPRGRILDIIIRPSVIVKLTKGHETRIMHAENDSPFLSHIIHYKSLPDPKTGQIELQYVEDIEKASPQKLKGPYYAGLDVAKQVDFDFSMLDLLFQPTG